MRVWIPALLSALVATAVFYVFQSYLARATIGVGHDPMVMSQIEASLEDQKLLAELDPERAANYRDQFDELQKTSKRLQILDQNRDALRSRYQTILLVIFAGSVLLVLAAYVLWQRRLAIRLHRIGDAITNLAMGRTDLVLDIRGRDTVARIAGMIEQTSRLIVRDRRRLAELRNLSSWQEAVRRLAHEMRTPLSAARLELDRLRTTVMAGGSGEDIDAAAASVGEELGRLTAFTNGFASFGQMAPSRKETVSIDKVVADFVATFDQAWSNLELGLGGTTDGLVHIDVGLMRQVLTNLCDNSSKAIGEKNGIVTFELGTVNGHVVVEVADTGPGISGGVRARVFEPYVTSGATKDAMGLGLAISKKILLDHGGDLELIESSSSGTVFRLLLPAVNEENDPE